MMEILNVPQTAVKNFFRFDVPGVLCYPLKRKTAFIPGACNLSCALFNHQGHFHLSNESERRGSMDQAKADHGGLYRRIRQALGNIQLIDAHEHLPSEERWLAQENDFTSWTSLLGYVRSELVCAGMPKDALQPKIGADSNWAKMRPFWRYVRNTGAGSLCRRALSMFCQVEDLDDSTITTIQDKLSGLRKPGIYRQLLNAYNITACVNANFWEPFTEDAGSEFFAPLLYTSKCALVQKRSDIHRLEKATNQEIYSLKTYLKALDILLEERSLNLYCKQRC